MLKFENLGKLNLWHFVRQCFRWLSKYKKISELNFFQFSNYFLIYKLKYQLFYKNTLLYSICKNYPIAKVANICNLVVSYCKTAWRARCTYVKLVAVGLQHENALNSKCRPYVHLWWTVTDRVTEDWKVKGSRASCFSEASAQKALYKTDWDNLCSNSLDRRSYTEH